LATSGGPEKEKDKLRDKRKQLTSSGDEFSGMTTGVGTPVYCSPEQLEGTAHYDQKVDIFALGVIFFEMCYRFSTGMERIEVLKEMRDKGTLPQEFEEKNPRKADLLKKMIVRTPSDRPTATEILNSDLLPPKLDDEIFMEGKQKMMMRRRKRRKRRKTHSHFLILFIPLCSLC
jgi:translation initiation factor 2-alpha kinase 4